MSIPLNFNPLGFTSAADQSADYLPALFLEGTGEQNIAVQTYQILNTGDVFSCEIDCQFLSAGKRSLVGWIGRSGFFWGRENTYIGVGNVAMSIDPDQRHYFIYTVTKTAMESQWMNYLSASGKTVARDCGPAALPTLWQYGLFSYSENTANTGTIRVWSFKLLEGGEPCILSPAISPTGEPCMFDKVTNQPFYNSGTGAFIVGMTAEQAKKLSKLPSTGGSLTISLPAEIVDGEGNVTDSAVDAAINTAKNNGWTITIQTYTLS